MLKTLPPTDQYIDHNMFGFTTHDEVVMPDSLLFAEWEALADRTLASPFLYPSWCLAFQHAFGARDVIVRCVRRHRELVALLPLLSNGNQISSATNEHTPEFGFLAEDEMAAEQLAESLFEERPDHIMLSPLSANDADLDRCRLAGAHAGYRFVERPALSSPYLKITGSFQDYEGTLRRSLRRDVSRSLRRLERHGRVTFEIFEGNGNLERKLLDTFRVESDGWKGSNGTAVLSRPETATFYWHVARWAAAKGFLRIFTLNLEGRPIAMYFAIQHRGTCHLLKGGYDETWRHYSPGKVLMHNLVFYGFSMRLHEIGFHGDADPYKLDWTDRIDKRVRFEAYSPRTTETLRWAVDAIAKPSAKYVYQRLQDSWGQLHLK